MVKELLVKSQYPYVKFEELNVTGWPPTRLDWAMLWARLNDAAELDPCVYPTMIAWAAESTERCISPNNDRT